MNDRTCNRIACFLAFALLPLACRPAQDDAEARLQQQRRFANPEAVEYLLQAQSALRAEAYADALRLADSAEAHGPNLADVSFLRGRILSEMEALDGASASYLRALELVGAYRGAHMNIGNIAQRQNDYRTAIEHYHREITHFPAAPVYVELGRAYAAVGRPDSAMHAFEAALKLDSTYAPAHMRAAEMLHEQGSTLPALDYARKGLQLEPENPHYRYVAGQIAYQAGRDAEAARSLRAAVEQLPHHRGAHYNLGLALRRLGEEDEARQFLTAAQRLQREQGVINEHRAEVEMYPDDVERWAKLGRVLYEAERYEEAYKALEVARALAPNDGSIVSNLASLDLARGHSDRAIARYRTLLARNPTLGDVWMNLGVAYVEEGRPDSARAAWRRAAALGSSAAQTYLRRIDHQKDSHTTTR